MKKLVLLYLILCSLFLGCHIVRNAPTVKYIQEKTCWKGDKEAVWNEIVKWKNTLYKVRRHREKYCVQTQDISYLLYCVDIENHHTKVEKYVNKLEVQYANTCQTVY